MTQYHQYHDVKVRARNGTIEWVDYGEIRELSAESAEWLAEELAKAAVKAKAEQEVRNQ